MFICLWSLREETKLYVHVVKAQLIASKAKYSPKEKKRGTLASDELKRSPNYK